VGLTTEQRQLVELQFKKRASEIAAIASQKLTDTARVKLREGWAPEDPKFFIYISDVRAEYYVRMLWAFAECWFETLDVSGVAIDEEISGEMRSALSDKCKVFKEGIRKSLLGDPWGHLGDYEPILRPRILQTQAEIDEEIERRYLLHVTRRNRQAEESSDRWIISLHGIRTRGVWQKELTPELNRVGFKCLPLDYGNFLAIQLLIPFLRKKKIRWFVNQYTQHLRTSSSAPSIVAHSFGTYLVAGALERYPEIRFDRIIFAGSIVSPYFDWKKFVPQRVRTVLNDCGGRDVWVRLAPWLIHDAGTSGRHGFLEGAHGAVFNRIRPTFGHSEHFYNLNFIKSWVPFLQNGECEGAISPTSTFGPSLNWRFMTTLIVMSVTVLLAVHEFFHR
jgi:hypothetical protein